MQNLIQHRAVLSFTFSEEISHSELLDFLRANLINPHIESLQIVTPAAAEPPPVLEKEKSQKAASREI